jgi:cardiolipin synthase
VHDPAFLELLHRIDQSPILPARRLEVFTDGNRALVEMIDAIDRAGEEVLLQSYIFKDDSTGHAVVDALGKAVERGVRVRVLADAVGSVETRAEFWQRLEKKRIAFRLFHPLRYPWLVLFRDHRKILVVDRAVAFTGGMNIAEEYGSGLTHHRGSATLRSPAPPSGEATTWRDTHLRVEGPAAWEFAVVFRESWLAADGPPFDLPSLTEPQAEGGARCLVLDSRAGRGHRETALVLRAAVAAARRRIWITNAYFAPSWAALRTLCRASRRGVDVRLMLPGKSDVPRLQNAARGSYAHLLRHGVRIFEYQPVVLHAKTLVIDGHFSVVGSSNLDFRSFSFNSECNLAVFDGDVAFRLEGAFQQDLAHAREVDRTEWEKRPLRQRLRERFARWLSPLL